MKSRVAPPRNAELEAAIVAEPESPDAYLVYGDWLMEQGDPLGELVSVQSARIKNPRNVELKKREKELLRVAEKTALGAFADCEHTWGFGFLESVMLTDPSRERYAALLALVAARFLRELDITMVTYEEENARATLDAIVELGLPPALRKLALLNDYGVAGDLGDVSLLYPRLGRIKELTLQSAQVELGRVELPLLETFALSAMPHPALFRSLAGARWPKLRSLSLGFGDAAQMISADDLRLALTNLRDLRHLGVADHHLGNEVVAALVEGAVPCLAGLTSLDLSRTGMTDQGALGLVSAARAFAHLESIDLRQNDISAAACKQLERAFGIAVDVEEQGERDDERYDEIEE